MRDIIILGLIFLTPIIGIVIQCKSFDNPYRNRTGKGDNNCKSFDYQRDKCESYIEERLYDALKKEGFSPVTQRRCGPYWIDIALPEYGLAIECDGFAYHSTPEQKKHDARKNYYLRKNGWKVCRLSGKTINSHLGKAINHIKKRAYI